MKRQIIIDLRVEIDALKAENIKLLKKMRQTSSAKTFQNSQLKFSKNEGKIAGLDIAIEIVENA